MNLSRSTPNGIEPIALLHPEDTFGGDALEQMRIALAARKLELTAVGTYSSATTEMDKAVRTILDKKPQAIAIFATGAAAAQYIAAFRSTDSAGDSVMLTTSSSTSADYLISKLPLQQVRGVGVLQAVPPLSKSEVPIVKEYLEALRQYGDAGWVPSAYGLEDYISAKVLVSAIARVAGVPTAASVSTPLSRLGTTDVGGVTLDFVRGIREGTQRLDIGVITASEKLRN